MNCFNMIMNYLQSNPVIGCVASVYTFLITAINPNDILLQISAYGGSLVIILTIIAKALEIRNRWVESRKNKK